ncbi:type IV pilus modification PilV family protein [Desulforhopalus sp. 52FAK]
MKDFDDFCCKSIGGKKMPVLLLIHNQKGFTLLGALIGMAIFVIGILAIFALQIQAVNSTSSSLRRTEANTWAQDTLESLITSQYDDPALGPACGGGDDIDPLETVDCGGTQGGGFIHQMSEGPYTIKWVVFTSDHNGKKINDYAIIKDDLMFDNVNKTQTLKDIPDNTKLISVNVSHPRGEASQFVLLKSDT